MKVYAKFLFLFLACATLLTANNSTAAQAANKTIPNDVQYSIISETKVPNIKRSLEVRLNKKVSPEV
jgi:hypothetical protein